VVENGEVEVPFIGLERRGGSWSKELNSGRGVRFEVNHFIDEGDMVRHRCNTHFLQIIEFCRTNSALGCNSK
jgi:hypothetical protein